MMPKDQGIIDSNVEINPNKAYVLFIGDSKYMDTTTLLLDRLSTRYSKSTESVNILPNLPPPYFRGNYIVVNNLLKEHMISNPQKKYHLQLDQADINQEVSDTPYFKRITESILKSQKDLLINVFKNTPELTLTNDERIKVIGPNPELFDYFDNKINQRIIAEQLELPVPKGYIANSFEDLVQLYTNNFKGQAFVSSYKGYGGNGSEPISCLDDLLDSKKLKGKKRYIISELLDLESSITTQGIIANEEDVVILSMSDMVMDGSNYGGVVYPSEAKNKNKIMDHTIQIARYMGSKGYRGFFNFDFMEDSKGNLYFTEINPRKGGSTPEAIFAHKVSRPWLTSVPELELIAVEKGNFDGIDTKQYGLPLLNWGVLALKAKKGQRTLNYIPRTRKEKEVFRDSGITVLDHPGKNIEYLEEGRLARIICVAKDFTPAPRETVLNKLEERKNKIEISSA
ncbi:ATP-grasp domain-containing protein [Candidatus Woesearchaeota archaeon]|nr:ATP-grasp domain-containing protein [Candidatus Woesearchaeota archaeon]